MALANEILVARINRSLQKLFGMKGEVPSPQLSSEVMPVHQVKSEIENRYLEGWERFQHSVAHVPAAAQLAGIRIHNPSGSNTIIVLEHIRLLLAGGVAELVSWETNNTDADLATSVVVTATRLDSRGRSNPTLVWSRGDNPTDFTIAGAAHERVQLAVGVDDVTLIRDENQEVPLLPGNSFQLRSFTANNSFRLSLRWRERFLEESERT